MRASGSQIAHLLLAATLCSGLLNDTITFHITYKNLNWGEARSYCQENYFDLLSDWDSFRSVGWSFVNDTPKLWVGLRRDPAQDTAWRWINLRTGVGLTGEDFSHSKVWAENEQASHCAAVEHNKLYSLPCSSLLPFYCSSKNISEDTFYGSKLSWYKARQHCQKKSLDLATYSPRDTYKDKGWIRIYRVGGDHWNWSHGLSDSISWNDDEPLVKDCGSFDSTQKRFYSRQCSEKLPFICIDDELVLVRKEKTWEEALEYCEDLEAPCADEETPCIYQLLSLTSEADFNFVRDRMRRANITEVFVGLRFLAGMWWWMNGDMEATGKLPECPSQGQDCGIISKSVTDNWQTGNCSEKRSFVCLKKGEN